MSDSTSATIDVAAIEETALDVRTETEKATDAALGVDMPTSSDKALGRIMAKADKLLNNVRDTPAYLELGEECSEYVLDLTNRGHKRAAVIQRVTDRCLDVVTLDKASVRPNDWIAVYWLARLITDCDRVSGMPKAWLKSVSYRFLLALKFAVERNGDNSWQWKAGWNDKIQALAKSTLRGKQLLLAIEEHQKLLDEESERTRKARMSPEQVEAEERRLARIESDKQRASLNRMANNVAEKAREIGVSPEELRASLERLEVIPTVKAVAVPMDLAGMARTMTHQDAVRFADSLLSAQNTAVIAYLVNRLSKALADEKAKVAS